MKAYGVNIKDLARDCTSVAKYGSSRLTTKCACGSKQCKKSKDHKERKAKERNFKIDSETILD